MTSYLPAQRADPRELAGLIARAAGSPLITALLDASATAALVLDAHRQLVACNAAYLELLGVPDLPAALGLRPGESLGCVHAQDGAGGCGTGPACPSCGLAISLLIASRGAPAERTCALAVSPDGTLDREFLMRAVPLDLEGWPLVLVTMVDVTEGRRRALLEAVFLHDLANLACGLQAASDSPEALRGDPEVVEDLRLLSQQLVREVQLQRALVAGADADYVLVPQRVDVAPTLQLVRRAVTALPACEGRGVVVDPVPAGLAVETDPTLLHHVLSNMAVNAVEATPRGESAVLGAQLRDGGLVFTVWNPGAIPAAVVPRIFQRYFTTKRGGLRGHGTYAMKLFGEHFLGGRVSFTTSASAGTRFELALPPERPTPR